MNESEWEAAKERVTLHAWERWTQNGHGQDYDDREASIKDASNAVHNAWQEGMSETEWLAAALKALGVSAPPA